jgi:hypothetical protein
VKTRSALAIGLTTLALGACSSGQTSTLQDLEGVHAVEPDVVQVYYSPNQFPNVLVACPDGPDGWGYLITTREYQDPIEFEQCPIDRERGDVIEMRDWIE